MKAAFYTLGCKVNQYETQGMEQMFAQNGFEIVPFDQYAHVYIINTCTVTALSDKKSRNAARRAKQLNPQSVLVVCGCYAQVSPEEIKTLCGADIVIGSAGKSAILSLVQQALAGKETDPDLSPIKGQVAFEHLPAGGMSGRTRALLKVQDGCQNFCSYCKIPYARGGSRSLPLQDAVADALKLALDGYKELVITGIEISSYGLDLLDKPSLGTLISEICKAVPSMRIRLGSLEPRTITPEFICQITPYENLCHHFHLSLQSGCDKTLAAMNRKYTGERYLQSVELLRQAFPHCSVTTDLIVGFPGENPEDFQQSLDFIRQCGLFHVHIFPYSRRKGTKACDMPNQLTKAVKDARAKEAAALVADCKQAYLQSKIGSTLSVLFEQPQQDGFTGLSKEYCSVFAKGESLHNQVHNVRITGVQEEHLVGELLF